MFYPCILLKLSQGAGGSPRSSVSVEASPPTSPVISGATATVDASLQSTALRGSEGSASFTSPSLGPKAQAAVDSAREVVRRVLSNKVCQAILNANMHMHVAMSVCFCSYVLSLYFAEVISGRRWQPAK